MLKMKDFIVKHSILSIASSLIYLNYRRAEHRMSAGRSEGKLSGSNLPYFSFKLSFLSQLRCLCINACYLLFSTYSTCQFPCASEKKHHRSALFPYAPFLSCPSLLYMLVLFIFTSVLGHAPRKCQHAS